MNNFWNMVGFEFKKILRKKSVILTLIVAFFVILFSCVGYIIGNYYDTKGEFNETRLEFTQKETAFHKALTGRPIDSELLLETAQAYKKIPPTAEYYTDTEEYELYARPYSQIFYSMRPIYSTPLNNFDLVDIQNLTQEQADNFYAIRYKKILREAEPLNQKSKDKLIALNAQIEIPIIFEYTGAYTRFIVQMFTGGLIISLAIAICLAPIFAKEYTSKTDQVILSSKNGKGRLIYAKLFVGFSLSVMISIVLISVSYFAFVLIYGIDGANAPVQVLFSTCIYPVTMGQLTIIFSVCAVCANIFVASITMLVSAWLKSSFGVIIILFILILTPLFIYVPTSNVFLHNLLNLLPGNMMNSNLVDPVFYEIFGLSIEPFIFLPIFATVASIVLLPFAFKGFKNHQVA